MKNNKNKAYLIGVLVLLTSIASCSQQQDREQSVGRTHKLFFDESRPSWIDDGRRPLATTIWYPAIKDAKEEDWNIAIFKAGRNALNAELTKSSDKLPLIVLSHGTGGAAFQLSWLAEQLAQKGYIVAAVNHHGNTGAEEALLLEGFTLWWERAADVSSVIDHMLAEPTFAKRIDQTKIGVLGFSLGGYTAISIAGGITDRQKWQEFCLTNQANPICELPPEAGVSISDLDEVVANNPVIQQSIKRSRQLFKDERIRAAYSIAPVLGPAFTVESLNKITIPTKIVVGSDDDQAIPKYNAELIAGSIPSASFDQLPDVTHYTFLARCNLKGRFFVKNLCSDADGIDRANVHKLIGVDAEHFFTKEFY